MSKTISLEEATRYMVNQFENGHEIGYLRYEGARKRIMGAINRGTITGEYDENQILIRINTTQFRNYLQRSYSRSNPSVLSMMRNTNPFGI